MFGYSEALLSLQSQLSIPVFNIFFQLFFFSAFQFKPIAMFNSEMGSKRKQKRAAQYVLYTSTKSIKKYR